MRILPLAFLLRLRPPAGGASGGIAMGGGRLGASAAIDLRVVVPQLLEMKLLDHPGSVDVSATDAAAGEVVVSGPRLAVLANDRRGYVLQVELGGPFSEATIEGLAEPIHVTAAGARVLMPSMVGSPRPQPYRVQYRFRMREGTPAGRYTWPVSLSIEAP